MRGEHPTSRGLSYFDSGSSPLARGALGNASRSHTRDRIIPACAGSTGRCPRSSPRCRDHPRLRGEHLESMSIAYLIWGSSPLARGALPTERRLHPSRGIIPACAGSTCRCRADLRRAEDHPRLRGEHASRAPSNHLRPGSSPLARGAREWPRYESGEPGIIPACAGSTDVPALVDDLIGDHPRLRGEHRFSRRQSAGSWGSSPLARGALSEHGEHGARQGIIPACAGSTTVSRRGAPRTWDHPRLRGEHISSDSGIVEIEGSSPLARGALADKHGVSERAGIIPACAGSTASPRATRATRGDHPRLRGEHSPSTRASTWTRGSSPLARGAHGYRQPHRAPQGIIPACAGST